MNTIRRSDARADETTQVLIVGGSLVGLSTALLGDAQDAGQKSATRRGTHAKEKPPARGQQGE
jgi:hypothetical protein